MKSLTVYSKNICPYCVNAKNFLKSKGIPFIEVNIETNAVARDFIMSQGHKTVPQIYLDNDLFVEGGWTGLSKMSKQEIQDKLNPTTDLGTL